MLISPILTVMSVDRLKGGQLLTRGYVANFNQDILPLCLSLPRLTSQIPLLIVKKIDQDNNVKELTVNKERVKVLVEYLSNNPDWIAKGIKFYHQNFQTLPFNDVPTDLNEIINATDTLDKLIIKTGPSIDVISKDDIDEIIQTTVESDTEVPFQVDRISNFIKINWPNVDPTPINEFSKDGDGLATLAFPSLFPHVLADPTKKGRITAVTETEAIKHLLKYATKRTSNNEYFYPFVEHPRFKFWAYDRIRRHRSLESLTNGNAQNIMKRMTAYSANITGSDAYWETNYYKLKYFYDF